MEGASASEEIELARLRLGLLFVLQMSGPPVVEDGASTPLVAASPLAANEGVERRQLRNVTRRRLVLEPALGQARLAVEALQGVELFATIELGTADGPLEHVDRLVVDPQGNRKGVAVLAAVGE